MRTVKSKSASEQKETLANRILLISAEATLSPSIAKILSKHECIYESAAGDADALRRLRRDAFDVVITSPDTSVEEDLALLEEIQEIRPGIRTLILTPKATPEDVIAALRARVFACLSPPFDATEIASLACEAAAATASSGDIEVVCAHRNWVSLRMNCRRVNAERLLHFLNGLRSDVPHVDREQLMVALREVLMNSMEHGARFNPDLVIEVVAVRTARAIVFFVRDPGRGFHLDNIPHAAISNPPQNPIAHIEIREQKGLRPGGFGILVAREIVDEVIYNELGNEVLLIKHTA